MVGTGTQVIGILAQWLSWHRIDVPAGKRCIARSLLEEVNSAHVSWVASAFKWETTHVRTQSPIKAQQSPHLAQLKIVLKEETPSRTSDRQSLNFVQRDS